MANPNFNQVLDEFNSFKAANPESNYDLPTFAQMKDFTEGAPSRQAAYRDGWAQRVNARIDSAFSPLGDLVAPLGTGVDIALQGVAGYQGNTAESVMRGLPRGIAQTAGFMLAPQVGLPLRIAAGGVGMADAGLQGYAETDNVAAGVVNALSLPLGVGLGNVGAKVVGNWAARGLAKEAGEAVAQAGTGPVGQSLAADALLRAAKSPRELYAALMGDQAGSMAADAISSQASSLVQGQGLVNPLTMDYAIQTAGGALPFLPKQLLDIKRGPSSSAYKADLLSDISEGYNTRLAETSASATAGSFQPPSGQTEMSRASESVTRQADLSSNLTSMQEYLEKKTTQAPSEEGGLITPPDTQNLNPSQFKQELYDKTKSTIETPVPLGEVDYSKPQDLQFSRGARTLFHETNAERALAFVDRNTSEDTTRDLYLATTPDLALGQGNNKGVFLEFDDSGLDLYRNTQKPGLVFSETQGNGTELVGRNQQAQYQSALNAVSYDPAQLNGVYGKRFGLTINNLEQQGWSKTVTENGRIRLERPKSADLKFMSADRLPTPEQFAKFVNDVNSHHELSYKRANDKVTEQASKVTNKITKEFQLENPDVARVDRPMEFSGIDHNLMNPMVRDQLQEKGFLAPLTMDKVSQDFQEQLGRSLTMSKQEAYQGLVQLYVNKRNIEAREAQRQYSLHLQKGNQFLASEQIKQPNATVSQVQELIGKLPAKLQDKATKLSQKYTMSVKKGDVAGKDRAANMSAAEKAEPILTLGRAEQDRLNGWHRQLGEIVKNYDKVTGETEFTVTRKTKKPKDGKLQEVGQKATVRMSVEKALDYVPKATKEKGKTSAAEAEGKVASLDALTEEGAHGLKGERPEDAPVWTDDVTDGVHLESTGITGKAGRGTVERVADEGSGFEPTTGLNDEVQSQSSAASAVRNAMEEIANPKSPEDLYNKYASVIRTATGKITMSVKDFAAQFPLAVEAEFALKGKGKAAREKLAILRRDSTVEARYTPVNERKPITESDLANATQGIFGKSGADKQARLKQLWNIIAGEHGIDPNNVEMMKGEWDTETQTFSMKSDPVELNAGLREALQVHFELQGMAPMQVEHFVNLSVKGANALKGLKDLKFTSVEIKDKTQLAGMANQISEHLAAYGMYGSKYTDMQGQVRNNPWIGLVLNHMAGKKELQPFYNYLTASLAAHETVHAMVGKVGEFENSADPGLRTQATITKNTLLTLGSLTPEDRHGVLTNLLDTVVPSQITRDAGGKLKPEISALINYSASKPEETMATYAQMYITGLVGNGDKLRTADVMTALRFESPQMQDFVRGVFRDVSDYGEGLAKTASIPTYRDMAALPKLQGVVENRVKGIDALHSALKELIRPDAITERAKLGLSSTATALDINAYDSLIKQPMNYGHDLPEGVRAGIKEAGKLVYGIDPKSGTTKMSTWADWMGLHHQAALTTNSTVPMDCAVTLNGLQDGRLSLMHSMFGPLLKETTHGLKVMDMDKPLHKLRSMPEHVHKKTFKIVGELQALMQDGKFQKDVVSRIKFQPDGTLPDGLSQARALSPDLDSAVGKHLEGFTPEQRTAVLAGLDNYFDITRRAALEKQKGSRNDVTQKLARLIQLGKNPDGSQTVPGNASQLTSLASALYGAIERGDGMEWSKYASQLPPALGQALFESAGKFHELQQLRKQNFDSQPFYASEERVGKYMVEYKVGENGKGFVGATDARDAAVKMRALEKEGKVDLHSYEKINRYGVDLSSMPESLASNFARAETQAWADSLASIERALGPNVRAKMEEVYSPGARILEATTNSGLRAALKERKLAAGREYINYFETLDSTVYGTASGVTNKNARGRMELLLNDPVMDRQTEYKARAKDQMIHAFSPGDPEVSKRKTMMAGFALAGKFGSMLGNSLQNFQTGMWDMVRDGCSVKDSTMWNVKALKDVAAWVVNPKESVTRAKAFEGGERTKENAAAWAFQKYIVENPQSNVYDAYTTKTETQLINTVKELKGHKDRIDHQEMLTNGLYQAASKSLQFYASVDNFNAKASFKANYEHALTNKGMSYEQAYDYAKTMTTMSTYGGGRANQNGMMADGAETSKLKSIVSYGMLLQQYSLSAATSMIHEGKIAIMGDKNMTPLQRMQTTKAFVGRTMMQFALAGAVGMPFAAAVLKGLEEATGENVEQHIREAIAAFAGEDYKLGGMIADMAMRGAPNQILGIDVGHQMGLSNIMGVGDSEGFKIQDVFGPLPGIAANMSKATLDLRYGEPLKAAGNLLPSSMRNLVTLLDSQQKYGKIQFMDRSNNQLMTPGTMETIQYALGMTPERLAIKREVAGQIATSDRLAKTLNDKRADHAAAGLLRGDPAKMHEYVAELRANDPTLNPQELVKNVIDRSIDMATPKDFMAGKGPLGQKDRNRIIVHSFPGPFSRQSEMQRLQMREQAMAKLGYPYGMRPASGEAYQKAAMIDAMVQQSNGQMTKPEAARKVELMTSQAALMQTSYGNLGD